MKNGQTSTELIVALDVDSAAQARDLAARLGEDVGWVKVGNQLFTREGPSVVRELKAMGKRVFLDLKFHDIPNTVQQGVHAAAACGADMTNVHAGGGSDMVRAAVEAAADTGLLLVAVTVLTSMDAAALEQVGVVDPPERQVVRLARLVRDCGGAGVVCSALEIPMLRAACGPDFVLVVPGIRPRGAVHGDQKRVMTPGEAATAGADFIVVGRPITRAEDPAAAAAAILAELRAN